MAATITVNEVTQCLAKRAQADTPGLTSPPRSKRARSSTMPTGDGDLISPPISTQATIPTAAATATESSANQQQQQMLHSHHHEHNHQHHHHHHHHVLHQQQQQQQQQQQRPPFYSSYQKQKQSLQDDCVSGDDGAEDVEEEEEESAPSGDWDAKSWNTGILPALPAGLSSSEIRTAREDEACGQSVEDTYKRTLEHFPNPAVHFTSPTLEFDFRIAVKLKPESTQVHGRCHKEITAISSGCWSGSFGNGKIMAGGYDLGQARGFRPIRIVEGAFVMQTSDDPPATMEMRTRGSLSGPCDVLDTLLSCREPKDIDCRKYGFRMFLTVKTSDKRYAEIVNCGLWVASGVWRGEQLIIDAYRVA